MSISITLEADANLFLQLSETLSEKWPYYFYKISRPKAVEKLICIKLEFCCVNFHKIKLNSPKLKADTVSFFQLRLGHRAQGREPLIEVGFSAM